MQVRASAPLTPLNGFVENRGQWPAEVLYLARLGAIEAVLFRDGFSLHPLPRVLKTASEAEGEAAEQSGEQPRIEAVPGPPLRLRFPVGGQIEAQSARATKHHFLLGSPRGATAQGFERVVYRGVAQGVDLVVRLDVESFAYDLYVEPGADLAALLLSFEGVQQAEFLDPTRLLMRTSAGVVQQRIGAAWQVGADGESTPVASRFNVVKQTNGTLRLGFAASQRDPTRAFVLDPTLEYATYVGGSGVEDLRDIDVAPDGSLYIAARSFGGPTTPGAFQETAVSSLDAWAGKLSPDGSNLEWGTYLGGSATDQIYGVHRDADGTTVLAGNTWSTNFPITPGSLQTSIGGVGSTSDLFVTRLSGDGADLIWSTFLGSATHEVVTTTGLLPSGDVLVAAEPLSGNLTATPGAFDSTFNAGDQMLVRISSDGSQLGFLTYFKTSRISALAFDSQENIYLTGYTFDDDAPLPVTQGAFKTAMFPGDVQDGFVAKLSGDGTHLHWATYLGGDDKTESIKGIAVDAASAVYVVGSTSSLGYPVTPGAFDVLPNNGGSQDDGFVSKLLPGGSGLVWSTFLSACCGGTTSQSTVTVDKSGSVITVGRSSSPNYPTTPDAFQPLFVGSFPNSDVHLTKLNALGETLAYSTYLGGTESDLQPFVGQAGPDDAYMVFDTSSTSLPVTPGAYDPSYSSGGDLFVAKFGGLPVAPWQVLGGGLMGSVDTPNLAGEGSLVPGSPARLSVRGALPLTTALLVAGLPALNAPLKGGLLVPTPTVMVPVVTLAAGGFDLPFVWPNVPPAIDLFVQVWVSDPGAIAGWSATNALRLTSQ